MPIYYFWHVKKDLLHALVHVCQCHAEGTMYACTFKIYVKQQSYIKPKESIN